MLSPLNEQTQPVNWFLLEKRESNMSDKQTVAAMENIIEEVEHSLAVEHMTMTAEEKENLRKVGRGSLNFKSVDPERLCDAYIASMTDMADLVALLDETVTAI